MDFEAAQTSADDKTRLCDVDVAFLTRLVDQQESVESHVVPLGEGWLVATSPLATVGDEFAHSRQISRADLFALGDKCSLEGGWTRLLVASFAWGTGTTGYGPFRCSEILKQPVVEVSLAAAVSRLTSHGPLAAYFYLNNRSEGHIEGFGPAFFTKFLYFAGGRSRGGRALILDQVLAGAVRTLASNPKLLDGASWTTDEYAFYFSYVGGLARLKDVEPDEVECQIFRELAG